MKKEQKDILLKIAKSHGLTNGQAEEVWSLFINKIVDLDSNINTVFTANSTINTVIELESAIDLEEV